MIATVAFLSRHPVKGLSSEPLETVTLATGAHFPGDRLYAIENGPSGFDPAEPRHRPKPHYLQLMRNPGLARYRTTYDPASRVLTFTLDGSIVASGDLGTDAGRRAIEAFCDTTFATEMRGPAKVLTAPDGYRFMDSSSSGFVSILNLATLRALAAKANRAGLDPRRFRANIGLDGLPPWGEFDLIGKEIAVGGARLKALKRIDRCAATHADPDTGRRDIDMVGMLESEYGHNDCGIYCEVIAGGGIRRGDVVAIP